MHPVTASYLAKTFEHDRNAEADRNRLAREFRESLRPDAGRIGTAGMGSRPYAALSRRLGGARA